MTHRTPATSPARHTCVLRTVGCLAMLAASGLAAPVTAATHHFCWRGAGGYTMVGRFSYPDNLAGQLVITERDVTEFEIVGYFEGDRVGDWDLSRLQNDTSWHLRYDTRRGLFPLTGNNGLYQMWNANGAVNDCGSPGFGFNAGNGGQDVCIDNTFILTSTIDWDTPIVTQDVVPNATCSGPALIGKREDTP